ncbi:maleylpyruvate isomerase family mycothiol-dependent enzyme [Tessaracoccus sp. OS52]|uniref:maleylpyruvate isomerase family mycothiol-dependent enzyme n=1 Tax=Tessaracoccus sp. OS52 TaxID=2886691 RepID=UPI001D116A0B|nr:maleylpyruvate isomerase family mycothiol-dependent enzyme [Tessaracoccus sp. OS52]MCC2593026.1 maleylpyruvate isomerase family mycothiol-dependent enzyme [Tessaracoccus sp. OS52]
MSLAHRMRQSICDTFEKVGALAPTNCEGWQAQDLAAHLWVRDRRPDTLPGIGLKAFAGHTERIQRDKLHELGFKRLVDDVRNPPLPVRLLGDLGNGSEYAIHLFDVARPNGIEVELSEADERALLPSVRMFSRKAAAEFGGRLVVTPSVGTSFAQGSGTRPVHLSGAPSEILYFCSGRVDHADVELTGETETVEALRSSIRGL